MSSHHLAFLRLLTFPSSTPGGAPLHDWIILFHTMSQPWGEVSLVSGRKRHLVPTGATVSAAKCQAALPAYAISGPCRPPTPYRSRRQSYLASPRPSWIETVGSPLSTHYGTPRGENRPSWAFVVNASSPSSSIGTCQTLAGGRGWEISSSRRKRYLAACSKIRLRP